MKSCSRGVINGVNIRVEDKGHDDDTAGNDLMVASTSGETIHALGGLTYGQFQAKPTMCDAGTAVCGMRVLYEDHKGGDFDDTGLNDVELAGCPS